MPGLVAFSPTEPCTSGMPLRSIHLRTSDHLLGRGRLWRSRMDDLHGKHLPLGRRPHAGRPLHAALAEENSDPCSRDDGSNCRSAFKSLASPQKETLSLRGQPVSSRSAQEGQLFGKRPGSSGGSRSHSGRSVQLRALPALGPIVAQSRRSSIQGAPRRVRLCDEVFSPIVTHSYDSEVSGIGRVTQNKGPPHLMPALV